MQWEKIKLQAIYSEFISIFLLIGYSGFRCDVSILNFSKRAECLFPDGTMSHVVLKNIWKINPKLELLTFSPK